jgi:hypothetical protein
LLQQPFPCYLVQLFNCSFWRFVKFQ